MRNRALDLVRFGGTSRRSECVALDIGDLTFHSTRGVGVRARRSKTDQFGEGADVALPSARTPRSARCAHEACHLQGAGGGTLPRSVDRYGRVGCQCQARLDADLGAPAAGALAATAAFAGRSHRAIMVQGRCKSRTMVDRCVRTADAWRGNADAWLP